MEGEIEKRQTRASAERLIDGIFIQARLHSSPGCIAVLAAMAIGVGLRVSKAKKVVRKLGKMAKGLMREQRRRQRWILWVLETDFSCDWSELTPPP